MPTDLKPPSNALYLSEGPRALLDVGSLLLARSLFASVPGGDGHPVLVLPGMLADDASTQVLRGVLRARGHDVHGWNLGRNVGPTQEIVDGLHARVDELTRPRGSRQLSVVGWSLGGILARTIARRRPSAVRQVITLASPFLMQHPVQSRATSVYQSFADLHVEQGDFPLERGLAPLPVPTTSIYSPLDGIVHWSTCLNPPGPQSENVAVRASHTGIGLHPAAIWVVADRLAQPAGSWSAFKPPCGWDGAYLPAATGATT